MGARISLGQVRPKKRRVRDARRDTPCDSFIAPGFDEDDLFPVNPRVGRQTMNEGIYLDRGAIHACKGKTQLTCVPEMQELSPIPGIPEHVLHEIEESHLSKV